MRYECPEKIWLITGNDVLQDITSHRRYQMRIDLEDFQGATKYATYSGMWVAPESDNYRLTLGKHSGTAGNGLFNFHVLLIHNPSSSVYS